jgi:hypothetical protein
MTETGGDRPRAGRRAAVLGTRRAVASLAALIGACLGAAGGWLSGALRTEADAARLAPWLPVAFGIGILIYFTADLNPNSLEVLADCKLEPALAATAPGEPVQFERQGYFCLDTDSAPGRLVFNRTVGLRDSWAKVKGA